MEHRHRCAQPNLLGGGLILRLQPADSDAKAYCYCDGQCDCNGNSLNSNIYSRSKLRSDSCRYSYCDPNPGADHSECARLQSARTTHGRPHPERSDFEQP